jgi:rRNA maturation endonuclease Nob1
MSLCPQVTVECPGCGHVFVAVEEAEAACVACGHELAWSRLRRDADGTWRAAQAAKQ